MDSLFSLDLLPYISAFTIGLLGGGHCIGMCGGIMAALSFSVPATERGRRWRILLSYNVGRIASYTLIGLLAGGLGYQFASGQGLSVLRIIAGLLLLAMGLYLAGWWRGLSYLEKLGGVFWRRLQPLGNRLMPVKNSASALMLGALWGWLPCGLVYTAVAYALAQASAFSSAGVMLAFGLGTLPPVLASGVFAERIKSLIQRRSLRLPMAILIMLFGVWTLWGTAQHAGHSDHAAHSPASQADHTQHDMGSHHSGAETDHAEPMPSHMPATAPADEVSEHHHH